VTVVVAGEIKVAGAGQRCILDVGVIREIEAEIARLDFVVVASVCRLLDDVARGVDDIRVVAGAADHHVGAAAAVERIVAAGADQRIPAPVADEHVGAAAAAQDVVAGAAPQDIGAAAADQQVVAALAVERILAGAAGEGVVAVAAEQPVVPFGAADRVVFRIAVGDQPAVAFEHEILDMVGQVVAVERGADDVVSLAGGLDDDVAVVIDDVGVVTVAAGHFVAAGAAVEGVVAAAAGQLGVAAAAGQAVVAGIGEDAGAAVGRGGDHVIIGGADDEVLEAELRRQHRAGAEVLVDDEDRLDADPQPGERVAGDL